MLLREDFDTHLYSEIITAIERDNAGSLLEKAISTAEAQAKGYLMHYDIDALFSAVGDARDALLLMWLKDLTVWHFVALANPNLNLEFWRTRYEDAVKELEKIQKGRVVPDGWPYMTDTEGADVSFHVTSRPRRDTQY